MPAIAVNPPFPLFTDADGQPLDDAYIYIGTANQNPVSNPITVYWDAALTITAAQPIRTSGGYPVYNGTPARFYTNSDYSILVRDKNGAFIYTAASETDFISSEFVDFIQSGTGAVATTVQAKLRETVSVKDFGAVGDGVTDDTAALLAFYNYCISSGLSGHILAGTYKVTPGVLIFDNNFTNQTWPVITTDGPRAVKFNIDSASTADAAVLTWRNGTASSGSGKYWRGGYHGGITITETRVGTYLNTHGLSLRGVFAFEFDQIFCESLRGAAVHIPFSVYAGYNPDPYATSFTKFVTITANNCGYAIWNENGLGMDGWSVKSIYATNTTLGVIQGIGSNCKIDLISAGSCKGWFCDDGTQSGTPAGTPHGNKINSAEIDNCEYGFRLNHTYNNTFAHIRFVHRFQTAPNVAAKYWPLKVMDLCSGTAPIVENSYFELRHRVEGGGTISDIGVFATGNNSANVGNVTIEQDYTDEGSIGITDSTLYTSFNRNGSAKIFNRSKVIYNSMDEAISFGRGSASTTIPNTGFASISSKINFPTQIYVTASTSTLYNTSTSTFTAPRTGLYSVNVSLPFAVAIGTRVRIGIMVNSNIANTKIVYAVNAGTVTYDLVGSVFMNAGDTAYITADQNTGGSVSCAPVSSNDEVRFVVNEIGY